MDLEIFTFPSQDQQTFKKEIKKGRYSIYLISSAGEKPQILKAFPYTDNQPTTNFLNESRFSFLKHKHIISTISCISDLDLPCDNFSQKTSGILMEYAPHGDFVDLMVTNRIGFSEKLTRTYFHQLINALEFLHSQDVAHLDLKPHNMLLGGQYQLKLADFDLSYKKEDEVIVSRGSKFYRAPELIVGCCQDPESADIFAAGIILFFLKCRGMLPHYESEPFRGMDLYGIMRNDDQKFWETHCKIQKKTPEFFSQEFKELFKSMTATKPNERASIEQIKKSAWFQGPIYSSEELEQIMHKKICQKENSDNSATLF
jgi:serine/threonine protein kinase